MKVTIFTGNQVRHNYFINLLSQVADELFVIQEVHSQISGTESKSKLINEYFSQVNLSQNRIFKKKKLIKKNNIKIKKIKSGELSKLNLLSINQFLDSDIYIVFGSSYIKGKLIELLIKNKAINIHMGISPFYRGTDCNFWAMYDNNPHLVGATIHYLSRGLDSGNILYHSMPKPQKNNLDFTMSSVISAFHSLFNKIVDRSIFTLDPIKQNEKYEIRYSKNINFNETILKQYLNQKVNTSEISYNKSQLINPFFLDGDSI